MGPERIGLMGGSFNPIHLAHLFVARSAMEEASLSKVLFLPTGNPPHKRDRLAPALQRLMMVKLGLANEKGFCSSDVEITRSGTIYTVDTLALLQTQMPQAEFYYIIGEDTLYDLLNWKDPDRVFQMCRFLVCSRSGEWSVESAGILRQALARRGARFSFLSAKAYDMSSTGIRAQLENGEVPDGLDPAVLEYIRVMGLYGIKESPAGFSQNMARLADSMSIGRLAHTMCVSYAARHLAAIHGWDPEKAALAGLLHDCAKGLDLAHMQEYVHVHGLEVEPSILASGSLLHAVVGAHMAREVYGVMDKQVLSAIACHTLGSVPMTELEMIVYLADKTEPGRENYPGLHEIRRISETDLRSAVLLSLERTLCYVKERGKAMHPASERTMAWLREICEQECK